MNARVQPSTAQAANPVDAQIVQLPPADTAADAGPVKKKGVSRRLILMVSVPLLLALVGGYFWLTGGRYEDTDNAYVEHPKVSLSADIAGRITEVDVRENQTVKAGDVLFRIDPAPYQIALDRADAALAAARVNVEQLRVAYSTAEAKLAAAQQTFDIRQREQGRNTDLAGKGVVTAASVDNVLLAFQQAQSDVSFAKQALANAAAALAGDPKIDTEHHPYVRTALAAEESAQRDLANTTIVAPANGIVSQVANLNVGQFVQTGTSIASLVQTTETWVEANFKETQLGELKAGQPANVTVDAYPGLVLHGTVESIGAATGSEFSLLPAQNATGNWVKVVQRIPVRVKITPPDDMPLRSGMSASVTVDTGKSQLDKML